MERNTSRVFCVCMAFFLLIVGIGSFYNRINDLEDSTFAAKQRSFSTIEIDNTDISNDDSYCSEPFFENTEPFLSYVSMICKTNFSNKSWPIDLMIVCIIDLSLILKNKLYFFKHDIISARFLPYSLLQLQIIHKFDGKY